MSLPSELTAILERTRELILDVCRLASAITLASGVPPTVEQAHELEARAETLRRAADDLVQANRSSHGPA
jgi:hypothetical protein